ncbi:hypothetical protein GOODEAATRI_022067, partial [Goodea atripinnis]
FLLDFISYPVIKGFTCAAANILGIQDVPHQFFLEVYFTFHNIPEARVGDVVLGLVCLALLIGPPPTSDSTSNGTIVSFKEIVEDFGGGLAVIPLMGVLESIAIAKAFGKFFHQISQYCSTSQNNYRIDANQELLAIGVTNIMGSFVSAYPVTGSFGRFVSDHGALVMELSSGLSFPAVEHLSHIIHTQALQSKRFLIYYLITLAPCDFLTRLHLLSTSLSSEVCGVGLPSCEHHRLHSNQRAEGPAEAVQPEKREADVFRTTGAPLSPFSLKLVTSGVNIPYVLSPCFLSPLVQLSILKILLEADLQGFRYTNSVEEALLQMESVSLLSD